jgi:hypothetical protein
MIFSQREDTTRPLTDHSIEADLRRSHGLHPTPKISLWVSNPALNFGWAAKESEISAPKRPRRNLELSPRYPRPNHVLKKLPETQPSDLTYPAPPPFSSTSTAAALAPRQLRPLTAPPAISPKPLPPLSLTHLVEPPNRTSSRNPIPRSGPVHTNWGPRGKRKFRALPHKKMLNWSRINFQRNVTIHKYMISKLWNA